MCVCVWVGCRPSFRAPADLPDTKPCPAQDQLTIHPPTAPLPHTHTQADTLTHGHTLREHSQSITTASGRQQCTIKVQDLYLSHNDHETLSLFSLYLYTATVPDGITLILTVYMVISNRCMCNLSSSVCLFFWVILRQLIVLCLCVPF